MRQSPSSYNRNILGMPGTDSKIMNLRMFDKTSKNKLTT